MQHKTTFPKHKLKKDLAMPHALSAEKTAVTRLLDPRDYRLAELLNGEFTLYVPPASRLVDVEMEGKLVCIKNTREEMPQGGTSMVAHLFRVIKARDKMKDGEMQVGKPIRVRVKGRPFKVRVKMVKQQGVWGYTDGNRMVLKRLDAA